MKSAPMGFLHRLVPHSKASGCHPSHTPPFPRHAENNAASVQALEALQSPKQCRGEWGEAS